MTVTVYLPNHAIHVHDDLSVEVEAYGIASPIWKDTSGDVLQVLPKAVRVCGYTKDHVEIRAEVIDAFRTALSKIVFTYVTAEDSIKITHNPLLTDWCVWTCIGYTEDSAHFFTVKDAIQHANEYLKKHHLQCKRNLITGAFSVVPLTKTNVVAFKPKLHSV